MSYAGSNASSRFLTEETMFGTFHVESGRWQRGAQRAQRDGTPYNRFLLSVDHMLYIASAAFAACVLTILLT
jgi:hypothetical protein